MFSSLNISIIVPYYHQAGSMLSWDQKLPFLWPPLPFMWRRLGCKHGMKKNSYMPSWWLTSVQISIHKFKIQASTAICFLATIWKKEKPKADVQVGEKVLPGLANFSEFCFAFFYLPSRGRHDFPSFREGFQSLCQFPAVLGEGIRRWPASSFSPHSSF